MKLNNIETVEFKNLQNFKEDVTTHSGLSFVIGNNASGKSNFLELLSEIFFNHYQNKRTPFPYKLSYTTFNGTKVELDEKSVSAELPKRLVAVYSGEEDRLWKNYYEVIYKDFIGDIIKKQSIDFPKMLYLNKFYWEVGLVSLLLSDADDVTKFIKENLGINEVNGIEFTKINRDFKNSVVKGFADSLNDNYTLAELKQQFATDNDFFTKLYLAFTDKDNKLIDKIDITFNGNLKVNDLSEGQKKQLLIKCALEFAGQEDTLFLLDEPDAHIHLENKKAIFDIIKTYTTNRHIVVTSHSPTLTKLIPKESIICLENGSVIDVKNTIDASKYLASAKDIYRLLFTESNILIVEGKTDDKYISKAIKHYENDYPELDFQILRVGGTDDENIKNLIEAIDLKEEQKIIILVDRDEAGYKVYKKLFPINPPNTNHKDRKDIVIEKYADNIYFLMVPHKNKPDNNGDFLVEDYFKKEKIIELAKQHIDSKFVSDTPCKNFPDIKKTIKSELLPEFSKTCSKADMEGFKILLDKLKEAIDL
ncbi:AAA family ATPase [uncultured Aquimarina sp.]|uniref:ATP-dependent nuclease n=1 Tax=uncultured Aquimarina sp. TaxID=575652 RepID=UPI002612C417|nr:AAA family ATPase [uncultured Aquimarina sp.]